MAIIRNATALLAKGDRKTAAKVLFNLGTAPRTNYKATADALQKLQVRTISAFNTPLIPNDIAQVDSNFSASDLYKSNLKKSVHKGTAHGFYGWSDELFFPIASRKASAPSNIVWQLSRLQLFTVKSGLHPSLCYALTAASFTALNKTDEAEQRKLIEQGNDPKLRPIQSGSHIIKPIWKCALATASGKRVQKELSIYNVGIGTSEGPATITTKLNCNVANGHIPHTEDLQNAFNSYSLPG
jgi:hypothetical protein